MGAPIFVLQVGLLCLCLLVLKTTALCWCMLAPVCVAGAPCMLSCFTTLCLVMLFVARPRRRQWALPYFVAR